MNRQTKYFLVGTTLAALILLGGYLTSIYEKSQLSSLNSQLSSLTEKCRTETAKIPEWARAPETKFQLAPAFCDPLVLGKLGADDIQKQIYESQSTSGHIFKNAKVIALFVFLLFGAPYAWYFLLRRIRELRDAFVGK